MNKNKNLHLYRTHFDGFYVVDKKMPYDFFYCEECDDYDDLMYIGSMNYIILTSVNKLVKYADSDQYNDNVYLNSLNDLQEIIACIEDYIKHPEKTNQQRKDEAYGR